MRASWQSLATLALAGCAAAHPLTAPAPAAAPSEVDQTLLLIGDAGAPAATGSPVLEALSQAAAPAPERTTIVFLGDNVYPRGVPDSGSDARTESERRLRAQIEAAEVSGARAVFIPGNHDWAKDGPSGWDAIRRQQALVRAADSNVAFLPSNGCPGPSVLDLGRRVRLVLIDTQWWLHPGPKPQRPDSTCTPETEAGVADSLRGSLAAAGDRIVVVAGHHPLASASEHGGRFVWTDHIFPLRAVASWLWLPLPIVGSAYPIARQHGVSRQDFSSGINQRMRSAISGAFAPRPPLIYVSGHEHTLQVFEPSRDPYLLVSGTGTWHHSSAVGWRDSTRYASRDAGFMRLDALRDGGVRLGVWTVAADGTATEAFSMWLRRESSPEQ